jgi:hypothetical protein
MAILEVLSAADQSLFLASHGQLKEGILEGLAALPSIPGKRAAYVLSINRCFVFPNPDP